MRHGERVDDGFLKLVDDFAKAAYIVECDWDVLRRDNVHGYGLLVGVED